MEGNKKYGKPTDTELRKKLTPIQYDVTQKSGTERDGYADFLGLFEGTAKH